MTGDDNDLAIARLRAKVARARLAGTLVDIQARLKPKALIREAVQEMKEAAQEVARDGLDSLKRHPIALAGATVALSLLFARGPLRHIIETYMDETPEPPASLTPKRARARRKGPSQ